MYARVVTTYIKPESLDEAVEIWREKVVPTLKGAKGFKSSFMTGDRKTGKGVVFSLWETEADATVWNTSGKYQEVISHFARLFTAPPTQEQLEVLVQV
ncbi:antibiotic biosynthesis monooxygenase [uncultured Meiothermus sp.]|jgi:heme-degrading monooxygenase HmoA|uniref:antibiotic biosynthesis monooxygenase family protein n=1 Tax=uncultured Meiothermus sp. TaxID=157471 RepID=UPI00262E0440|nr:antibiotic biosynthesis monooxygenase [uncultured Meiothermus sp.]